MNKKKILIHLTYAIGSIGGNVLCKQLRYINNKYGDTHDLILILSNLKTPKRKYIVEELSGIRFSDVIVAHELWKKIFPKGIYKYDSWAKFYREENWFDYIPNVDKIYMFGGLINSQLLRDGDTLNRHVLSGNRFLKFVSASTYISTVLQLLKLSNTKGIELNEIVYDPQEASLDTIKNEEIRPLHHSLWFCYDIPKIGAKRLDYIQDAEENAKPSDKTIDFCFGSTFVSKHRYDYYDKLTPILDFFSNNSITKTFIYHNKKDIDTRVDHGEYQKFIAKSRFTLIIPSYDIWAFSMIRFYEALCRGCLPLIFDSTFTNDFRDSFGIEQRVLDEITITSNINSFTITEERRTELIKYLQLKLSVSVGN